MAYTEKFQHLADVAISQVTSVDAAQVNALMAQGRSRWTSAIKRSMTLIT